MYIALLLKQANINSSTCTEKHALGETFCAGIDRVSDYTVLH